MPDNTPCEDCGGTGCSRCWSPDVATQIIDPVTEEVLAESVPDTDSSDCCECEDEPGVCCSKCLSPDVDTETATWDPGEMAFAVPGTTTGIQLVLGGGAYSFTFTIYPGTGLPYAYISVETDEDWPDGSIVIYDENGDPVLPYDLQTLADDGNTYTAVIDPSRATVPGTYTGRIRARRVNAAETEEDINDQPVEWDAPDCTDDAVDFYGYGYAFIAVALPGDIDVAPCNFRRSCGTDPVYWRLSFETNWSISPDWPGTSSYELWDGNNGTLINEATVYGPINNDNVYLASIKVDTTGMVPGTPYWGRLTLRGYSDAFGTTLISTEYKLVRVSMDSVRIINITAGPVLRAVDFIGDLEVEFQQTGLPDEDYEGGDLQIDLMCEYAPPDAITPVLVADADLVWTLALASITNLNITGGAGTPTPRLHVLDLETLAKGSTVLSIATAGPNRVMPYFGLQSFVKNGASSSTWQLAYASFEPQPYTAFGTANSHIGSSSYVSPPFREVDAWMVRFDTSPVSGLAYSQIDITIDQYVNGTGTTFRMYACPSLSATPPLSDLDAIRALPASFIITAIGGPQTHVFSTAWIASTYLYLYLIEDVYMEPPPTGGQNYVRTLNNGSVTIHN